MIFQAPPDREARLESRAAPALNLRNAAKTRGGVEGALARMQESLERVEAKQSQSLAVLEESFEGRARRMRSVLSDLGINPGKALPAPPPPAGVGGPFVPANLGSEEKSFERQLYRIHLSRSQVDRLTRTLLDVPVRKPVSGEIDMSSGFGTRMDPFLRSPAMHTGLDMRGDTGDPVRATANGTVTMAGTNGGYGKMVEIEHSNGLSTRYAHLSAIDVKVGQAVKIGQIIGKTRLDRPLDRSASALRNARRRRSGRSAEISARGHSAGTALSSSRPRPSTQCSHPHCDVS